MSNQILISSGAKLRDLDDVIIGTDGVLSSLGFNVANGVPKLDENGKILVSQLPNSVMEFKGVWNAATNTPTLANGTGNAGDVYLCNVAGTVNFGAGPITFAVGDYAVYTGSVWARSSGATGTVTSVGLSRDGDALSVTGSPITTSGTINIGFAGTNLQYINGAGNLVTFPDLTVYVPTSRTLTINDVTYDLSANRTWTIDSMIYPEEGIAVSTGTAWGDSIVDNSSNWNTAYNNSIVSAEVTGTTTKTLTLDQQDGGTITASWTDYDTAPVTSVFGRTGAVVAVSGDYTTAQVTESGNLYFTDARARAAISLTTLGTSGAATYNNTTGVLNIPNYTTDLTGYVPYTGATTNVNLGVHSLSAYDLIINHTSGSGVAASITKGGNGEALTVVKSSGSGNAASITGGVTLLSELHLTTDLADAYIASAANWNTAYTNRITSATSPLSITSNVISISLANTTTSGYLSSTDWNTFNGKQNALTNPVTGTGTLNYVSKFTATGSTIGSSLIYDNGTSVSIGTATPISTEIFTLSTNAVTIMALENRTGTTKNNQIIFKDNTSVLWRIGTDLATNNNTNNFSFYNSSTAKSVITLNSDNSANFYNYVKLGESGVIQGQLAVYSTTANAEGNIYGRNGGGMLLNTNGNSYPIELGGSIIYINKNLVINSSVSEITPLIITAPNTITAPAFSIRQTNASNQGYDFDTENNTFGRLDLYGVTSTGRVLMTTWMKSTGNFLIGTTTDAGYKLNVNGTIRSTGNSYLATTTTGVVGIGTTSNVSSGSSNILQIGSRGIIQNVVGNQMMISNNAYYDGAWKYIVTNNAQAIRFGAQLAGDISFHVAPSGTAGANISDWDDSCIRMYISPTGNVGVGTKAPEAIFTITKTNGNYTSSSAGHIVLNNLDATGQSSIYYTYNGTMKGKLRSDYVGNMNYTANGGDHNFLIGGDVGTGTVKLLVSSAGTLVNTTSGVSGGGALQVNGNVNINGVFQINGVTIGGGGGSGVTGSGTTSYVPKWSSSSSLSNSIMYDTGSYVGFNTTSPQDRVDINGSLRIRANTPNFTAVLDNAVIDFVPTSIFATNPQMRIAAIGTSSISASINFLTGTSTSLAGRMFLSGSTGNLMINTTTDLGGDYKLQVQGAISMAYAFLFNFKGSSGAGDVAMTNSGSTLEVLGNFRVQGTTTSTGGFFDTSDARLKTLVEDNYLLSSIANVKAKLYIKNGRTELGYYAQDLESILPSAVSEGSDGFLSLSYAQVHTAKIAVIEDEVTILKNRVSELETKLKKYDA